LAIDSTKKVGPRHGLVVYDTKFGNTEKIAKSLQLGLKEAGIETTCVNAEQATLQSLKETDLIVVGGPTQTFSASKSIKGFFEKLKSVDLQGKFAFAFDTKYEKMFSGSAAKYIESELKRLGLQIISPRESAIVRGVTGRPFEGAWLKEGEERRFEQIGRQVGTALVASTRVIPA
jgi:flavorubredoxin